MQHKKSTGCYENIQFSLSCSDKSTLRSCPLISELNSSRSKMEKRTVKLFQVERLAHANTLKKKNDWSSPKRDLVGHCGCIRGKELLGIKVKK